MILTDLLLIRTTKASFISISIALIFFSILSLLVFNAYAIISAYTDQGGAANGGGAQINGGMGINGINCTVPNACFIIGNSATGGMAIGGNAIGKNNTILSEQGRQFQESNPIISITPKNSFLKPWDSNGIENGQMSLLNGSDWTVNATDKLKTFGALEKHFKKQLTDLSIKIDNTEKPTQGDLIKLQNLFSKLQEIYSTMSMLKKQSTMSYP
jgi:hypothetical protein